MLKISFTTRLLKNLVLSMNMAESDKVDFNGGGNYKNKTVKRLPLTPQKLDKATNYLTPNTRLAFTQLR